MEETSSRSFSLDIITPDKKAFSGEVNYIKAPGIEGYLGILTNHAPLLSALKIGELEVLTGNQRQFYAISGGFMEVLQNQVRVLAETAEQADEIDLERAVTSKERAENRLASEVKKTDIDRAHIALYRAINRIKIAGKK